ncbi:MAG TPA: lantibiotic dehydratase [Candidatus Obscuribacterales bacterium]
MIDVNEIAELSYEPIGGVLVRMPLLPIECNTLREPRGLYEDAARLALFAASPSLYRSWTNSEKREKSKTRLAVAKYMKRMSSRPTPYGLFAGVSWARISEATNIMRGTQVRLSVRPDSNWLCKLVERLEQDTDLREQLLVITNMEALIKGGRVWVPVKRANALKPVNSVRATPPVLYVLESARLRPIRFGELVSSVERKFGVKQAKAKALINTLLQESILLSSLRFPLGTPDPLRHVFETLKKMAPQYPLLGALSEARARLDSATILNANSANEFEQILESVEKLPPEECKDVVQTDAAFELQCGQIGLNVITEMSKAVSLLVKLSPFRHNRLNAYARAFEQRYQTGRVVPILELIDDTFGLGSPYSPKYQAHEGWHSPSREQFLLRKLFDSYRTGTRVIELMDSDVAALTATSPGADAPLSADLFVQIVAASAEAINCDQFDLLVSARVGEAGAGKTIARFAQLLGEPAMETLHAIKAAEEKLVAPETLAEISFWPDVARMMNVALAPQVGLPLIPIRCVEASSIPQIPLSDIVIGIEHGRFFAQSLRTGQRLRAQSSTLLNPEHYPDAGRLLVDVALQNHSRLSGFDWGVASSMPYLPRVVCGRIILSPARWNLNDLPGETSGLREAFAKWCEIHQLPDKVVLCNGPNDDNQLLLALSDNGDLDILIDELVRNRRKRAALILQEYIPTYHCEDAAGRRFATELVGSFIRRQKSVMSTTKSAPARLPLTGTTFMRPLGSDWCYLRLDCAAAFHDDIISSFRQAVNPLIEAGKVKKWFFVRYADNLQHLRLRLDLDTDGLFSHVLPLLCRWAQGLLDQERCSSYSFQSYDREVERFGGIEAIGHVEAIFSSESDAVAEMLGANQEADRRLAALLFCDALIDCFGLDRIAAQRLLHSGLSTTDRQLASEPYRVLKAACITVLEKRRAEEEAGEHGAFIRMANRFRAMITPHANAIKKLEREQKLECGMDSLLHSLIHMQSNRLFGINSTAEAITRGLLARTYGAVEAMEREAREKRKSTDSHALVNIGTA